MKDIAKIAIIGGGNLGVAIAKGLKAAGFKGSLVVTRRRKHLIESLTEQGIAISSDNMEAVSEASIVFLAVKPKHLDNILREIQPSLQPGKTILISLATGVSFQHMHEVLGADHVLFRAMPNTAISIRESMTCLSSSNASKEQETMVTTLFNNLGETLVIPEDLMAASTVLAACGIAFALRFIRAAMQGGVEIGFGSENALKIAAHTVKGAADLIIQSQNHPEREIDKVTTPMGITISGLNEMEHQGFSSSLIKGLITSYNKIENGNK